MKYSSFLLLFILSANFLSINAFSQALSEEALQEKLFLYSKANPSTLLFVHTDKTVYTNNEILWFSAYLINSESVALKEHTILSVALMREDNREIFLQDKYATEEGLSFGSISLPDSIPPGNYQFIASTNILDKSSRPLALFTQLLTIKSITEQNFNATLTLVDTAVNNGVVRVNVNVLIKDPDPKLREKASIEYLAGKGAKRSAVLNQNTYTISIPAAQLSQTQPNLLASVKYNNATQFLSLKLPEIRQQGIHVRFFPEGGSLSDGLESTVGWEAKTSGDIPVSVSGILLKDDRPFDTVKTNSYGMGTFRLKPDSKSNYTLKIAANSLLRTDTLYTLPRSLDNGIVMQMANAVINDTLRLRLFSKQATKVRVFIHNYQEGFASFETEANPAGTRRSVTMPIIPKGIATVTVLDLHGKPLAERLFFAHYDQKITASIQSDKPVYNKKDSAHVTIKLLDQAGAPVHGIVSIAAVQDNRLEGGKEQDIESYFYLSNELGLLPRDPQGRGFNNKSYLENILLVKGWRKFTWQDLVNSSSRDTAVHVQSPVIKGAVTLYDKPLKKPVDLSIRRDSLFDMIQTEADGSFELDREQLLITEGRKVFLFVNDKLNAGYTIKMDDPFILINQQLANQTPIVNTGIAKNLQTSSELQLKGMERVIALQTVTIKANKDDGFLFGTRMGANACGDYVCRYNNLNCRNHPNENDNRQPVTGEVYNGRPYMGCITTTQKEISLFPGIYLAREYYGVNGDAVGLKEPQYFSTLFWKPGMLLDKNGQGKFSFFTGDVTGKFRIVIQGVGEKDMIFSQGAFAVK